MLKPESNYLKDALNDNMPCRWNKSCIKVYIHEKTIYKFKKEEVLSKTIKAFEEWHNALKGKLDIVFIDNVKDADITVQYQRNDCNGTIGLCQFTEIEENGAFKQIDICIGLIYSQFLLQNIMHEIGHSLGLMGHSPCTTDLMFDLCSYQNLKLTQRDINTINLLYNLPLSGEEVSIFANKEQDSNPIFDELEFLPEDSPLDLVTQEKPFAVYQKGGNLSKNLDKISELKKYQLTLQNLDIKSEYKIY